MDQAEFETLRAELIEVIGDQFGSTSEHDLHIGQMCELLLGAYFVLLLEMHDGGPAKHLIANLEQTRKLVNQQIAHIRAAPTQRPGHA